MKLLKSKRFWVNLFTVLSMSGVLFLNIPLTATQAKLSTLVVGISNLILQVWFNQDKKTK